MPVAHYATDGITSDANIYFISVVPHLIKTARNCFSNSNSHKSSRSLWRNGKSISWMHIVDLYKHYCTGVYRLCPRLSRAHVKLPSFSLMNVHLPAQVLSKTVADAILRSYGDDVSETVKLLNHEHM